MIAYILATGPSLRDTWNPAHTPPGAIVIAVNHAVDHLPPIGMSARRHWVFGDAEVLRDYRYQIPVDLPACALSDNAITNLNTWGLVDRVRICWNWARDLQLDETTYSATAALALAAWLGATTVLTHGVDHAGNHHHFDEPGHASARCCNDERHAKDQRQWKATCRRLGLQWYRAAAIRPR